MYVNFLFIGGPEIFIIVLIVVMVFGADKIPEIARGLGKGIRQVKEATNDIKKEINDSATDQGLDAGLTNDIKTEIKDAKEGLDKITDPIKRNF